ncbi:hypothetical protein ACFXTH_013221 [Malus domestica]
MVRSTLAKILDKHCLEWHNFPSWYRNVQILLTLEKIVYVLDKAPPHIPLGLEATEDERAKYDKHVEDDTQAKCYLLASMNWSYRDSTRAWTVHLPSYSILRSYMVKGRATVALALSVNL